MKQPLALGWLAFLFCGSLVGMAAQEAVEPGASLEKFSDWNARVVANALGKRDASELFGLTELWTLHLVVQPKDFATMEPEMGERGLGPFRRGNRGPVQMIEDGRGGVRIFRSRGPGPDDLDPLRKERVGVPPPNGVFFGGRPGRPPGAGRGRGPMGIDFQYVPARLEFEGKPYGKVAVRYKGNSSFMSSQGFLKRSLKIDFNDYADGQRFFGMTKLNLNCNAMDPSQIREALAYEVFRAGGITAARTAFAKVYLTVPGQYERQYVGLYTLIEQLDKRFLEDRFGTSEAVLLKPEGWGGYVGEEWEAYRDRYDAKTEGTPDQQKRFIEFAKLFSEREETIFREQIASYMDVSQFLRHLAISVLMSNWDSILSTGHNFYLFLNPQSGKVEWFPWDLNLSFQQGRRGAADLSIMRPSRGGNDFIQRVLDVEEFATMYRGHLQSLLSTAFDTDKIHADIDAIAETVRDAIGDEQPISRLDANLPAPRPRRFRGGSFSSESDKLKEWVTTRVESVEAQLAGKSEGTTLGGPRFPPQLFAGPDDPMVVAMLAHSMLISMADEDHDGWLSRDEMNGLAANLFHASDTEGTGRLDQARLAEGLIELIMRPTPMGIDVPPLRRRTLRQFPPPLREASALLAAQLLKAADANRDGSLNQNEIRSTFSKWFDSWRKPGAERLEMGEFHAKLMEVLDPNSLPPQQNRFVLPQRRVRR